MTGSTKRKLLILLGLVTIMTAFIAAGLPGLELQPGMPLPKVQNGQVIILPAEEAPQSSISIGKFSQIIFLLILAGAMLFVFYKLAVGARWNDLGTLVAPLLLVIIGTGFILLLISLLAQRTLEPLPLELPIQEAPPLPTGPLGAVPAPLIWLVGAGLLLIFILLAAWLFRSAARPPGAVERVGLEAEKAWQALQSGLSLKEVIIQCYRQMSLALAQEQGIEREGWMTTREFEHLLEEAGLALEPVHQLTQLFEAVRYGDWQPNPADLDKASACLQAIITSSRELSREVSAGTNSGTGNLSSYE